MIRNLYRKAIAHYGIQNQIEKMVEECAEVVEAVMKHNHNRDTNYHVCEEIADALIMLEQMQEIFGYETVEDWKAIKLKRLDDTINK